MPSSNLKVIVVPNWAARRQDGTLELEASHPLLLDRLTARLGEVTLAAPVHAGHAKGIYAPLRNPSVRFLSLGEINARQSRLARALFYLRLLPRLVRVVRRADICYIFLPGHVGLLAAALCRLLRVRYALYLRGDWEQDTPRAARGLGIGIFRGAAFILCTGESLAAATQRFNPRCEAVVPMSQLLRRYPLPAISARPAADSVRLLFVGELLRPKGPFDLLEAFSRLRKRGLDVRLRFIGDGADRARLEDAVQAARLGEFVHFAGLMTDPESLADAYRDGDIFCLPTYYAEGFPRVFYEAMNFALPIVTTPVAQIPHVLKDGRSALFHSPRDIAALEAALARLAQNSELRQELGAGGRAALEPMVLKWKDATHGDQVAAWLAGEASA